MDNKTRFTLYVAALRQFAERTGHTRVPAVHVEIIDDKEIFVGAWVGYIRQRQKRNILSIEKQTILSNLPGWEWGPLKPGPSSDSNRNSEILQMRSQGMTLRQIADSYDLSRQRVHQIVKKANA
jgi:hypothetical protein